MANQIAMIYGILFCGLPIAGSMVYVAVCIAMAKAIELPPYASLFFVFAAYGAVLLFAVSAICDEWSGMHSIAAVGLVFIGVPCLLVQSFVLRTSWKRSAYHRVVIAAGACLPLAVGALIVLAGFAARQ
jgi:hypothetical protein